MPHNHINDLFTALSALPDHGTMRQIIDTAREICGSGDCNKLRLLNDPSLTVEPVVRKYIGAKMTIKF